MMGTLFFKVLAREVRWAREARAMSMEEFSAAVKLSPPTIRKIEAEKVVRGGTVRRLVSELGWKLDDLKAKEAAELAAIEAAEAGPIWKPVARISLKAALGYAFFMGAGVGFSFAFSPAVFGVPMTGTMQPAYGLMLSLGIVLGSTGFGIWLPFSGFAGKDGEALEIRVRLPLRAWLIGKILRR